MLISGIIVLFLLVGGSFLIIKNVSTKTNNFSKSPEQKNKPTTPKDNLPDQPNNPPPSQPNPTNNDKKEIKVFWNGNPHLIIDGYDDYWVFVSEEKPADRFLISQKLPILLNKNLSDGEYFTLAYSENKVVKTGKLGSRLILLENNFTLTPLSLIKNDPDFSDRWNNSKVKEVYFDYSKYNGGDYVFIDNQILEGKAAKDCDKYVFSPDNPSIKKLLAKNHLQIQNGRNEKQFRVFYLERDIKKYDPNTRTYYFHNGAKVRTAIARP